MKCRSWMTMAAHRILTVSIRWAAIVIQDLHFIAIQHSNSGVALRNRYEVQILDDYGRPPDTHSAGALYSRIAPSENASKAAGEWETYDIRLVGREVTVV